MSIENNILGLDDLDQKIYRVFPIKRALELFKTNVNTLVHPSLWDDPFENLLLKARVFNGNEEIDVSRLQASWYGQCWTTTHESDAMWRIYSPKKDGVRITTTVKKLLSAVYVTTDQFASLKYFIGRVEYLDTMTIKESFIKTAFSSLMYGGQNVEFAKTLLIKRQEFEHEHEVRLLFYDSDKTRSGSPLAPLNFDANGTIEHVLIDPRSERKLFAKKFRDFESVGCKCAIDQSELYQAPQLLVNY